jgi:curved DNA-binding protein CbpA
MTPPTLYRVLMVDRNATSDVIGAAFRVLAKRYHPDHDQSDAAAARMAELNRAYAVLRDPDKRAKYDEMLGDQERGHDRPTAPRAFNAKYDGGAWTVRDRDEPVPQSATYGEGGPPPSYPPASGNVLSFGRYRGWTIAQVATRDRDYLEWLARTQAGRTYRRELDEALGQPAYG